MSMDLSFIWMLKFLLHFKHHPSYTAAISLTFPLLIRLSSWGIMIHWMERKRGFATYICWLIINQNSAAYKIFHTPAWHWWGKILQNIGLHLNTITVALDRFKNPTWAKLDLPLFTGAPLCNWFRLIQSRWLFWKRLRTVYSTIPRHPRVL